jgi:hypothetical protein
VVKAVITAVHGPEVGWNKLERRATVTVEPNPRRGRPALEPADSLAA